MCKLLLFLLLPATLAAQADGDAPLFARRALLSHDVRSRLGVGVADFGRLEHVSLLRANLAGTGTPGAIAVLRAKSNVVVAWFADPSAGAAPDSCAGFEATGSLAATVAPFAGAAALWVRNTSSLPGLDTTHCRVMRLWRGRLVRSFGYRESALEKRPDGRIARRWQAHLEAGARELALVIRRDDELDDEAIEGTNVQTRLGFAPDQGGGWRLCSAATQSADTAERCRAARQLERDGLADEALRQAKEALETAQARGLPADNPRRLEAAALVGRLQARMPAAAVDRR